jgi:hypothetical protein
LRPRRTVLAAPWTLGGHRVWFLSPPQTTERSRSAALKRSRKPRKNKETSEDE